MTAVRRFLKGQPKLHKQPQCMLSLASIHKKQGWVWICTIHPLQCAVQDGADAHLLAVCEFSIIEIFKDNPNAETFAKVCITSGLLYLQL